MLYTCVLSVQDASIAFATIGILLLFILIPIISIYRDKKHTAFVIANSQLLKSMDSLNSQYRFHVVQSPYHHIKTFHSKPTYDKAQFSDLLADFVLCNETQINQNIYYAETNARIYRMYRNECDKIRKASDLSAEYYKNNKFFFEIEDKLFREKIKYPTTNFEIVVVKQYTSPQGRNHYEDHQIYSIEQIQKAISQAKIQAERKKAQTTSRQTERAKMTDALRYEILKRDKGRCCLCGASAADGVKLHVDHIKPVAKGGKTEPSNLRTLCDRCNLGKGAKYDPNGYN